MRRYLSIVKISLDRLDSRALEVDLPGPGEQRIAIGAASGLRGTLERSGDLLSLSGGAAESVSVEVLRLVFGKLVLSSATGATFEQLGLTLVSSASRLAVDVAVASLVAFDLRVAVDDVLVTGRVELGTARLAVRDDAGSLAAERVLLSDFTLRVGDLELAAETLAGLAVELGWGAAGFSLTARSLEGPALRMTTKDVQLAAKGVALSNLALDADCITVGHLAMIGAQLAATMRPPAAAGASAPPGASAPAGASSAPLIDWRVLEGLSGDVEVDLDVDLTVPIIGSRQATHRFRIPVARGTLDFRALEDNLSALENAVLDFSVRDDLLVLERVNPLFPARGHGKPIVVWDLDPPDLVLAESNLVRLSVLPLARLAGSDDEEVETEPRERSRSAITLRRLGLHQIDVRLTLSPIAGPLGGQLHLRRVDSLVLQGNVFHSPGAPPRAGGLLGEVAGVAATIAGLRVGTSRLDVAGVAFASLAAIELAFSGLHATSAQLDMAGVALDGVKLAYNAQP